MVATHLTMPLSENKPKCFVEMQLALSLFPNFAYLRSTMTNNNIIELLLNVTLIYVRTYKFWFIAWTPSWPPSHLPPLIQTNHYLNTQQGVGQSSDKGYPTPTSIIYWFHLCKGTFRRPSDIVCEQQLKNRLHPSAPPSNTRGD